MKKIGKPWFQFSMVVGIHDYEQFYEDIFRKAALHAKKHIEHGPAMLTYWSSNLGDQDFKTAIEGFVFGLTKPNFVFADKQIDHNYEFLEKKRLRTAKFDYDLVEQLIQSEYEPTFTLEFGRMRYATPMDRCVLLLIRVFNFLRKRLIKVRLGKYAN